MIELGRTYTCMLFPKTELTFLVVAESDVFLVGRGLVPGFVCLVLDGHYGHQREGTFNVSRDSDMANVLSTPLVDVVGSDP